MELHISLVGRRDLAGEIYRQVRQAIVDGRLRPGEPLPPTRELAHRLSVARTTVTVAYDRLVGEGFATSRVGAGTFVADSVHRPGRRAHRKAGALRPRPVWDSIPLSNAFLARADFDFRTGLPDTTHFPFQTWRRLMAGELRVSAVGPGFYGHPAGHPALRDAIARHVTTSRGLTASADDVTVTNGTQQALDLIARVLVAPGEQVAVEDPGYQPPRWLFSSLGLRVSGVTVDDEGLVVDALPRNTRLVYVTPSHQYPLGMTMSLARRLELLAWADRHNAAIIEDDYDTEFRYGGRPLEPLHSLDTTGRTIYVGSFSKTMLTTLRIGFVISPPALLSALHAAKYVTDWHTALPTQAALARFINEGLLARHIRKMRAIYERRHDSLLAGLAEHLHDHLAVIPAAAGLHVGTTARTLSPAQVAEVARRAIDDNVAVQHLAHCRIDQPARSGLALGYGAIDATNINQGLSRLRRCFDETLV